MINGGTCLIWTVQTVLMAIDDAFSSYLAAVKQRVRFFSAAVFFPGIKHTNLSITRRFCILSQGGGMPFCIFADF